MNMYKKGVFEYLKKCDELFDTGKINLSKLNIPFKLCSSEYDGKTIIKSDSIEKINSDFLLTQRIDYDNLNKSIFTFASNLKSKMS